MAKFSLSVKITNFRKNRSNLTFWQSLSIFSILEHFWKIGSRIRRWGVDVRISTGRKVTIYSGYKKIFENFNFSKNILDDQNCCKVIRGSIGTYLSHHKDLEKQGYLRGCLSQVIVTLLCDVALMSHVRHHTIPSPLF